MDARNSVACRLSCERLEVHKVLLHLRTISQADGTLEMQVLIDERVWRRVVLLRLVHVALTAEARGAHGLFEAATEGGSRKVGGEADAPATHKTGGATAQSERHTTVEGCHCRTKRRITLEPRYDLLDSIIVNV